MMLRRQGVLGGASARTRRPGSGDPRLRLGRSSKAAALVAVAVAASGWLAWQELWAGGDDAPLPWLDLTARTLAQPSTGGLRIYHTRAALVRELTSDGRSATVPPIDFARRTAILVASGPRSSSAYGLEIHEVREERQRVVVVARERTPSLATPGAATLSFPFRLLTIARRGKPVTFDLEGRP